MKRRDKTRDTRDLLLLLLGLGAATAAGVYIITRKSGQPASPQIATPQLARVTTISGPANTPTNNTYVLPR